MSVSEIDGEIALLSFDNSELRTLNDTMAKALVAVDRWLRESPIREIQMAESVCGLEAPTYQVRAALATYFRTVEYVEAMDEQFRCTPEKPKDTLLPPSSQSTGDE
jgi:hypothetical protein